MKDFFPTSLRYIYSKAVLQNDIPSMVIDWLATVQWRIQHFGERNEAFYGPFFCKTAKNVQNSWRISSGHPVYWPQIRLDSKIRFILHCLNHVCTNGQEKSCSSPRYDRNSTSITLMHIIRTYYLRILTCWTGSSVFFTISVSSRSTNISEK